MAHAEDLPEASPVSAEARGKAREFIRRATAEDDLRFNTAALKVDRRGADFVNVGTFCLSFHAIGRYFQRQPDRGDAALLGDLALFSRITVPTDAPEQNVQYPTEGGAWVGRIALCTVQSTGQMERRAVPFIRTWLPV